MTGSERNYDNLENDRSSLPDQVYTFVIIALALFLIGLAVFRPPAGDITVESVLNYTRQNAELDVDSFQAELRTELTSTEAVERALSGIREDLIPPIKSSGGWGPLTERLAERIDLEVFPIEEDTNLKGVRIGSTGPNEAFQWQLVQSLQQQFEDSHNRPVDLAAVRSKHQEARDEVASAVGILDFTQKRIDDYVRERLSEEQVIHEQRLASAIEQLENAAKQPLSQDVTAIQPDPQPKLPVVESVNANWRYLKDEIDRLRRQRDRLANASTETEPDFGSIDSEIKSLEAALATTPKVIAGAPSAIENPFVQKDPPKPTPSPQPEKRELDLSQLPRFDEDEVRDQISGETDFKRLLSRLEEAKTSHNKALDKLKSITSPDEVVSETVAVVQSPKVMGREPGEVTAQRAFTLLIPSVLVGLICAWFRSEPDPPPTFVSPSDVEEWLDIPVVGAVTTGDGPRIPEVEPPEPPGLIRAVRRVAEVTVCAAILLVIIGVVTISEFGSTLISDPFTAYTQAVANVGNLFG